jgi:hypothetical protein
VNTVTEVISIFEGENPARAALEPGDKLEVQNNTMLKVICNCDESP